MTSLWTLLTCGLVHVRVIACCAGCVLGQPSTRSCTVFSRASFRRLTARSLRAAASKRWNISFYGVQVMPDTVPLCCMPCMQRALGGSCPSIFSWVRLRLLGHGRRSATRSRTLLLRRAAPCFSRASMNSAAVCVMRLAHCLSHLPMRAFGGMRWRCVRGRHGCCGLPACTRRASLRLSQTAAALLLTMASGFGRVGAHFSLLRCAFLGLCAGWLRC